MLDYSTTPRAFHYSYVNDGHIIEISPAEIEAKRGGGTFCPIFEADYYDKPVTDLTRKKIALRGEAKLKTMKRKVYDADADTIKDSTLTFPDKAYLLDGTEVKKAEVFPGDKDATILPNVKVTDDANAVVYDQYLNRFGTTSGEVVYYFDYLVQEGDYYHATDNCFKHVANASEPSDTKYEDVVKAEVVAFAGFENIDARLKDSKLDVFKNQENKTYSNFGTPSGKTFAVAAADLDTFGKIYQQALLSRAKAIIDAKIAETKVSNPTATGVLECTLDSEKNQITVAAPAASE